MDVEKLIKIINADFFTGVPDSQLKALCNYLSNKFGVDNKHHIIAANEGNATAIAAGYYLATGNVPVVYLQNSGLGNIINPVTSLLNDKVYAIPTIFIVGWRGEPNVKDEPQHIFQGEITLKLLEDIDIKTFVISRETTENDIQTKMIDFNEQLKQGKSVAFVVKKDALDYSEKTCYRNDYKVNREEAIEEILKYADRDVVISTTGKASREVFEIRERNKQSHECDFLTVGSMGHCSSIALGVALNKPEKKVWCIDGDGSFLMHMGSSALVGANKPQNMVHIVINNSAHETVGGMPTSANSIDLITIAKACGYSNSVVVDNISDLNVVLKMAKEKKELFFIEVKCSISSRKDLGRPTTSTFENKQSFMNFLNR